MFESVVIENFRGIEKLEVPLSPLTVLVGPNGVGKSSVLDAISLGGRSLHDSVETLVRSRRQGLGDPALWLVRYGQSLGVVRLRRAGAEVRVEIRSHRQVVMAKREDPSGDWEAACQIGFGPTHNAASYSGKPGPVPVQFVDSAQPYDPRDMSARITDIQRRGLKPQLEAFLRALDARIRSIGMDATLDGIAEPAVELEGLGSRPLALSGDGVRFMAQLVVGLMQSSGGAALLEEPETHLHPAGIRALADAIVLRIAEGDQVVLTTHSLELVERLRGRFGGSGPSADRMTVVRLYRDGSTLATRAIAGDRISFVLDEMGEDLR